MWTADELGPSSMSSLNRHHIDKVIGHEKQKPPADACWPPIGLCVEGSSRGTPYVR